MVLEEFKDFGLESCGNGFWGRRCLNCGAIVDLVIAAHQRVTLRTAACNSIVMPLQGSSLPLNHRAAGHHEVLNRRVGHE